jgi:glycosyltransferase involved in cell wall biosynthesis
MNQYPKILIIGQSFNKKSGGGVTISNLFKGWPKDRLAVASNTNLYSDLDTSVCDTYYQLGYNNKLHPFPLNIILPKIQCGLLSVKQNADEDAADVVAARAGKYKFVYNAITALLHFFGLYNILYKLKITPYFSAWVKEYKPDVIYTQLASLELIRFTENLRAETGKPIAIHIMDDWPLTINKPGLLYNYWQNKIDTEFRQLLNKSQLLMSISNRMSDEYRSRYGKEFIPFHNPIDINFWKPKTAKDYSINSHFIVLYAGRIGFGIENSITEIAEAVNEVAAQKNNIEFHIQTGDTEALKKLVSFTDKIKWIKPTAYNELPVKFASADLLLLPQDFDDKSVRFLRFSFPTKVSEYMISGTPVLVYGDESTGLTKYALQDKWAYVITQNKKQELVKAITELYENQHLRKELAQRAQKIAEEREDAEIVREAFRKVFIINSN